MKDTFGQALYGYWKGDHKTPHFIRRDDGFLDETPTTDYFNAQPSPSERQLIKYAQGKVLDVGCGAGRTLSFLEKKGFEVYGIDASPLAIKVCKERGLNAELNDVFKMKNKLSFDTILLFGNNIGIGGDLKGAEKLLKKLWELTKKGGRLLLTSLDVTKTTNPQHIAYHKMSLKKKKYVGEVKIRVEYKDYVGSYFKWIHVDPDILKVIADKTDWKLVHLKSNRSGSYLAVLEK